MGQNDEMPNPGKRWRHVIINTKCSWHHGDARGFRSRRHRIHSSGDYKHRPPKGEHEGLLNYRTEQSGKEVRIAIDLRPTIGKALAEKLTACGHQILCVALTKVHAHFLVELPDNIIRVRAIVGEAKRYSSRQVKAQLPGSVWAARGKYKPVDSRQHLLAAFEYILYEQGDDAWTWSARDRLPGGRFARKRPLKYTTTPHAGAQRSDAPALRAR
jgi:REP element-mobilizing transposase RayT